MSVGPWGTRHRLGVCTREELEERFPLFAPPRGLFYWIVPTRKFAAWASVFSTAAYVSCCVLGRGAELCCARGAKPLGAGTGCWHWHCLSLQDPAVSLEQAQPLGAVLCILQVLPVLRAWHNQVVKVGAPWIIMVLNFGMLVSKLSKDLVLFPGDCE